MRKNETEKVAQGILNRLARLSREGNRDGIRHVLANAAAVVVPSGNAADRRKRERAAHRWAVQQVRLLTGLEAA